MTAPAFVARASDADFDLLEGRAEDVLPLLAGLGLAPVDAVVTSPPYADARRDVPAPGPDEYADWAASWLQALLPVVRPEGSLMLNLGRLFRDGEESDYWTSVLTRARAAGWRWLDTIVWHKVNGGGGRRPLRLINRHEYVFWLAPSTYAYAGLDEARQPYSPATLARYTRRWSAGGGASKLRAAPAQESRQAHPGGALPGSVFTTSVGVVKGLRHPTPMDADLAKHLVRLSCPPGGLVLDPFAGSGTTAVACRQLARRCVAVEVDPEHCSEALARLSQLSLLTPA